jgi:hypothetical protein
VRARTGVESLMRVRVVDNVRFAFGQVEWGGPLLAVTVLAGSTVYSHKLRCLPKDSNVAAFLVAEPVYVRGLDGSLVSYEVVEGNQVRESVLDPATWQAWFGAVGTTDAPPLP